MLFIFAIFFAFWCKREVSSFILRTHQQIFQDCHSLVPFKMTEQQFIRQSTLRPKESYLIYSFFIVFPLIIFLYGAEQYWLCSILMMLYFLSVLDILYYLIDSRYVVFILLCSLGNLIFEQPEQLNTNIFTLFSIICFFSLFDRLLFFIFKREVFGLGDIIVLVALSPLFQLEQFFLLLLFSSLFGILYMLGYKFITKITLKKLPFIPFISLAMVITYAVI